MSVTLTGCHHWRCHPYQLWLPEKSTSCRCWTIASLDLHWPLWSHYLIASASLSLSAHSSKQHWNYPLSLSQLPKLWPSIDWSRPCRYPSLSPLLSWTNRYTCYLPSCYYSPSTCLFDHRLLSSSAPVTVTVLERTNPWCQTETVRHRKFIRTIHTQIHCYAARWLGIQLHCKGVFPPPSVTSRIFG